jgi:DNA-binding transcriptional regulator YiaG
MPDIVAVLRQEITRLARKEIRLQVAPLKKTQTELRRRVAELQREGAELARTVKRLEAREAKALSAASEAAPAAAVRYSPAWLAADRKRLGLSAEDYGRLVGVSGQTIYSWEAGTSRPRAERLAAWAAVRRIGKREARRRLEQLASPE